MAKESLINQNGSITVEAAVIVPVVILAVLITLYITLIIFQTCVMNVVANNICERAAGVWLNQYSSFETGKVSKWDIERLGLYRRWSFEDSIKGEELQEAVKSMLEKASILKARDIKVEIKHKNTILSQQITVELSASYINPLGGLTGTWGFGRTTQLKVQSQSVIDDPVEFLRNSDFIIETASGFPIIGEFESKWNEITAKIVEYVNSLKKERSQVD